MNDLILIVNYLKHNTLSSQFFLECLKANDICKHLESSIFKL